MELTPFFRSVLEQDRSPVVLCDLDHMIVYMNPSACRRYADYGGKLLLGKSLMDCHTPESQEAIRRVLRWFSENPAHNIVYT